MIASNYIKVILGLLALVAITAVYVVLPTRSAVYAANTEQLRALLKKLTPPVVFSTATLRLVDGERPDRMEWMMEDGGVAGLEVALSLQPETSGATRIRVSVIPPDLGVKGPNVVQRAVIRKLFEETFVEQIDATLLRHDFRWWVVSPALMIATVVNMSALSKQMDSAAATAQQRDADNIRKAYEAEAQGRLPNYPPRRAGN